MGAICKTIEHVIKKRTSLENPANWLVDYFNGEEDSATGVRVNKKTALKYTPFWSAVRIISGTFAALPFKVYQRLAEGKNPVPSHPVYGLLHDRVNPYIDAITFWETRISHVLTYGNGYAEIQRNGAGRPVALWPLLPNKVERKIDENNVPYYEITLPNFEKAFLRDENVLHIKGLGFDGYTGYDVVTYHKQAISYGIAVKEYGARFFGNDATPGGVLETPAELSDPAYKRLKESWSESHKGLKEAHRIAILEENTKFNKIGTDPEQAQALDIQKWNVDDCSRIFQMPPHMLGSMEFSKYNNVEQLELEFYKRTMLYWFRKGEQEVNYKMFMPKERGEFFAEILADAILRADMKTRYMCYKIGIDSGFLLPDEPREKENLNPLPDGLGKKLRIPLNIALSGDNKANEIKTSHRALIASNWIRIIESSNGDIAKVRERAVKLLREPIIAFASILNRQNDANKILYQLIGEIINENNKLTIYDATRLADLTMARIGGDYATT